MITVSRLQWKPVNTESPSAKRLFDFDVTSRITSRERGEKLADWSGFFESPQFCSILLKTGVVFHPGIKRNIEIEIDGNRCTLILRSENNNWQACLGARWHFGLLQVRGEILTDDSPAVEEIRNRAGQEMAGTAEKPIIDPSFVGSRIFTPEYIEKMGNPIYKLQRDTHDSTSFGWMFPCMEYAASKMARLMPQREHFRVMEWGPGFIYYDGRGVTEPLEIVGCFRAKGKSATVDCYDNDPGGKYFDTIFAHTTTAARQLCYLAKALQVETEGEDWDMTLPLRNYIKQIENSVRFYQQDVLDIDRMETEPYDLIMMLNLFPCISDRHPETKDNILYHALRLLRPNGLLMFNDCNDYEVKDWAAHFARRLNDLPVRNYWTFDYDRYKNGYIYCVVK